jgi:hypothetical protein
MLNILSAGGLLSRPRRSGLGRFIERSWWVMWGFFLLRLGAGRGWHGRVMETFYNEIAAIFAVAVSDPLPHHQPQFTTSNYFDQSAKIRC